MAKSPVDQRPNVRTNNIITQENTEHILHDYKFRDIFSGTTERAQSIKEQKERYILLPQSFKNLFFNAHLR